MRHIVRLDDPLCADHEISGGKGANLGKLATAGFPVPAGFVVTAESYRGFVAELRPRIDELVSDLGAVDHDLFDARTAQIRDLIATAPFPADLDHAIRHAYAALGAGIRVAIRSSGTAEDLAGASFAGQHDTYLDVRGSDQVLDAVRRCFGSLWTSRAVAYRTQNGFDHLAVAMPVVVQCMVSATTSGVLFTADPMSGAVDRYVVNAGWGLGEGVVSGILEPDQIVLDRETLRPVATSVGSKSLQVIRDPATDSGTVTVEVPSDHRIRLCLDDLQLTELGRIGRRVTEHLGDWPQDIEWAYADGTLHVLQAREITGVEFSWDEDLDGWKTSDPPAPDTVWSNAWTQEIWGGRITPLMYSVRAETLTAAHAYSANLWGFPELARAPLFKYRKGTIYFNSRASYDIHIATAPPFLRTGALLPFVPPTWHDQLAAEPFSWSSIVALFARLRLLDRVSTPYAWMKAAYWKEEHQKDLVGLPEDEIRSMTDSELSAYAQLTVTRQTREFCDSYTGVFVHAPLASAAMVWFLTKYYRGTNAMIFTDLITGLPERTITQSANLAQYTLADTIRNDPDLRAAFDANPGAAFFDTVGEDPRFARFNADYARFLADYGHRGQADRDLWYERRCENPELDYDAFANLMRADTVDHEATERQLIAQREAAATEVIEGLRSQPLAPLKIEAFTLLHDYLLRFFVWRDNQRNHADRGTLAKKRAFQEIGRRLVRRGVLLNDVPGDDDFYYLSKDELLSLLDRPAEDPQDPRVVRAKVSARRRNCDRADTGWIPPMYLRGDTPVDLAPESSVDAAGGTLHGLGTSRGDVTGTARVIASQKELNSLQRGDILVTHSTDPGWTPAFLLISGLVLETGGMLAHGSCISREYAIPAVMIPGAMTLIQDGATIRVRGDTGEVTIQDNP